ncbi:hypothetical protein M3Y96_00001300 [Aphelenchoides besseyi]|nr:hypothetical protein M3Y96_00001300 [Aphelenchoides besseyi]
MSTTSNVTWTVKEVGRSESSSETDEDEEYTTASYEDEDYEDEEDWEDEYDASLTISISANGLHPEDTTKARERSVTPDYECEFDLSLMVAATVGGQQSRRSLGGRTDQLNVLQPPPMFTASVTWDREDGMDEETEEFYAKLNQNDDDEDVNVGCTLSLLDRAAIQDSDEYTTDSEYESEYYEDEYDSDLTDEEEYSEEEMSASSVDAELNVALPSLKPTEIPETMQILSNAKSRSLSPLIRDHRPVITVQPIPAALDVNRPIESLLEDKSAIRKATVNMSLEEQRKAEEIQQELNRQKARANGSVSAMRDRFRQLTPPKAELITYKRSAMLEKKEVERPKRTYAIVKPMINDDFDKQIAELREQMKNKSSQLHNEYKDLSKGIHNKLDQEKLRTMEMEHRELLGKAKDTFSRADEERLIWQQQHISDVEKKHREKLECENQKQLEQKKLAEEKAAVAAADTRKVTRRVRRIGDPKTTEIKKSGVESLETNPPTAAIPQVKTTASLTPHKTAIVLEKKILSPTENKLETPPIELNAERRKSIPTNRRKTMELIRPLDDGEETELNVKHSKNRKRKHQPHRRNRFVRKPFDIDDLLGLSAFTDFEQVLNDQVPSLMDSYFACEIEYKRSAIELQKLKKRRVDAQKIWISQLKKFLGYRQAVQNL